jgi:endogenous inhibitor of DNA gyrase (YacG/DUF329 family)
MIVTCPQCRKKGEWFGGSFGPFCSKRCKLVDLGQWFNEEKTISRPLDPEAFADYENLPNSPTLDQPETE